MNTQARILNRVSNALIRNNGADYAQLASLRQTIPGWSNELHQIFFKAVLADESVKSVLVCGVYHGLDLAIMRGLLDAHWPGRDVRLVGVDLFSAESCADWPPEKRHLTWEDAFNCPPPSIEAARRNCPKAEIIACSSVAYLGQCAGNFDFIYLDTSHDETTVAAEIGNSVKLHIDGQTTPRILAGDDYCGPAEWGVDRAVNALLPQHAVLFDRIWVNATTKP